MTIKTASDTDLEVYAAIARTCDWLDAEADLAAAIAEAIDGDVRTSIDDVAEAVRMIADWAEAA